jgi:Transposase DDE domain
LLTVVDGTTFTVADTVEDEREFGRPGSGRGEKRAAFPQIHAACLIEVGTHAVFDARMDGCSVAETVLIEDMFSVLRPGMLVLADRNIYSFHRWIKATGTRADLLWRVNANLILHPVERLADGSSLAEITPPKKSGHPPFRLRMIEYRLPGSDEVYRLVTTILDPANAPAKELAALYHERWDIEGFLKQIKSVQLNNEKIFRSKSPNGVRQEFWAPLAVHYATMCVRVDAADQAQLDPDRISHKNTVRVIRSRVGKPESFHLTHSDDHYRVLLTEVTSEINPERRNRSDPPVVKRKMNNFGLKRARHRQPHQPSRPPHSAVTLTPPSKTGHPRRPAKTT